MTKEILNENRNFILYGNNKGNINGFEAEILEMKCKNCNHTTQKADYIIKRLCPKCKATNNKYYKVIIKEAFRIDHVESLTELKILAEKMFLKNLDEPRFLDYPLEHFFNVKNDNKNNEVVLNILLSQKHIKEFNLEKFKKELITKGIK